MSAITAKTALPSALEDVLAACLELEQRRRLARRVDGRIIGTGRADFTVANTIYPLRVEHMPVQLVDVPGIEGNEKKYAHLVEAAVAKAHLVIYVNGDNKKPEAKTAERIKHYLRRTTRVVPLINARGHADAYEFDEDRDRSTGFRQPQQALAQTTEVLRQTLVDQDILDGLCVQGLIAFAALARDKASGATTIHPDREADLLRDQQELLHAFKDPERMLAFSQINGLPRLLGRFAGTFKADIVEANKHQVIALLTESARALEVMQDKQQAFIATVSPHFDHCHLEIETIARDFLHEAESTRQRLFSGFFQALTASADDAVSASFGDQAAIARRLEGAEKAHYETLNADWTAWMSHASQQMNEDLQRSTRRLMEDVARSELHVSFTSPLRQLEGSVAATELTMDLSLNDWASAITTIGGYAVTGFSAGSVFPGAGNLIGAIAGTIAGILKAVMDFVSGKAERIRKAQRQLHAQISSLQQTHVKSVEEAHAALADQVHRDVEQHLQRVLRELLDTLNRPQAILTAQMAMLAHIKLQLEKMPHGSIREIQR